MFPLSDPWEDLIVQLVATLVGVIIGFIVAMAWDRKKDKEEQDRTLSLILDAIIEELKSIQKPLNDPNKPPKFQWKQSDHDFDGIHISVLTPAFESAVNSGNFSLLPPPLQTELGYVYLTLSDTKTFNDQIMTFYTTPIYTDNVLSSREAKKLCINYNDSVQKLRQEINEVIPKLESLRNSLKINNQTSTTV
jgi:hypothetical protein